MPKSHVIFLTLCILPDYGKKQSGSSPKETIAIFSNRYVTSISPAGIGIIFVIYINRRKIRTCAERMETMAEQQNKTDIDHLIWNRVMHIFTDRQNNKAGSELHQKSLINIHLFIDQTAKDRKVVH
ncbi:MAG: hypothetical protein C4522_21545 [Desulfobacteraceae bacterium]|nr:MAG: hypothetical protein C4522_21545 [Desulfobacteraceae bacterium]